MATGEVDAARGARHARAGRPRAHPAPARALLAGDAAATLAQLDEAHALGIDPASLLRGLMEALHAVTRAKAGAAGDVLQSAEEREARRRLGRASSAGRRSTACGRCCSRACSDVGDRARPARGGGDGAAAADPRRRPARPGGAAGAAGGRAGTVAAPAPRRRRAARQRRPPRPRPPTSPSLIERIEAARQAHPRRCSCTTRSGWSASRPAELVLRAAAPARRRFRRATWPPRPRR